VVLACALAIASIQTGAAADDTPLGGFKSAATPYTMRFPADHASHPEYRTEWWYYTGHLRSADGHSFGYELTFFRIGLLPGDPKPLRGQSRWRGTQLFPAHFAITDETGNRFVHTQVLAREALGQSYASTMSLDVRAGNWTLTGAPQRDPRLERMTMRASATIAGERAALDLVQVPQKPPAVHGLDAVSRKGACASCASHYYSYTRLATDGMLTYGGTTYRVRGTSWMDHEFGSGQLDKAQVGWDWLSIQLNDGRELMLYVLRRNDGTISPESSGSVIERDGSVRHLVLLQFSQKSTSTWKSPHTNAVYPSGWTVSVPSLGLDLTLQPTVLDQELSDPSGISYWEGSVRILNAKDGAPLGFGYVELTGYAGQVSL
jgi:predicted secreted hydrolase